MLSQCLDFWAIPPYMCLRDKLSASSKTMERVTPGYAHWK